MFKKNTWLALLICFTIPSLSLAAGLVPCGTRDNPRMCTGCDMVSLIQNIISMLFKYSIVIGAIFIMIAGFNMMFAAGNAGKVALAWKGIKAVIVGIVIIFSAWIIVNTVILYFSKGYPELQSSWNKLNCNP